jgi:hypothetical protein
MRRTVLIGLALLLGLLTAAPAFAQGRDPFEPQPGSNQQNPDGGSGSGDRDPFDPSDDGGEPAAQPTTQPDTNDPTDPVAEPTADPAPEQPAPDDEVEGTLANTGFDVTTWAGLAYALIALGAAALVFGRLFASEPGRHRK